MNFSVFSFSPIPDIETARHNFDLHDLSDKDVAKVLFHQRKQQTGKSEILTWNQQSLAAVSILSHQDGNIRLENYSLGTEDEKGLLSHLIKVYEDSIENDFLLISWDALDTELPLIRFRMMKNKLQQASFAAIDINIVDLSEQFSLIESNSKQLSDLAQRFYFPGMLGKDIDTVWTAQLKADHNETNRYCAYKTLNTYLLALEYFSMNDQISSTEMSDAKQTLTQELKSSDWDFSEFLSNWKQSNGS